MSKTEELRDYIAQLFGSSTDKAVIENAAVVSNKIDEIEAEKKASDENFSKLLSDYKDVVLHSSFKPANPADKGAERPSTSFDVNQSFEAALKQVLSARK